jgi:F0F1-type ATP synthase membrane subunit b/b'
MFDESFWILIAFILFFGALYSKIRQAFFAFLDGYIQVCAKEIEQADILSKKNFELLSLTSDRKDDIENEKRKILQQAKNEISRIEDCVEMERKELIQNAALLTQRRYEIGSLEIENAIREAIITQAIDRVKKSILGR